MAAKKFFDSSLSSSAFEREAALLADLRHPNVVQLIKVYAPHLIRRLMKRVRILTRGRIFIVIRAPPLVYRCAASPCRAF